MVFFLLCMVAPCREWVYVCCRVRLYVVAEVVFVMTCGFLLTDELVLYLCEWFLSLSLFLLLYSCPKLWPSTRKSWPPRVTPSTQRSRSATRFCPPRLRKFFTWLVCRFYFCLFITVLLFVCVNRCAGVAEWSSRRWRVASCWTKQSKSKCSVYYYYYYTYNYYLDSNMIFFLCIWQSRRLQIAYMDMMPSVRFGLFPEL